MLGNVSEVDVHSNSPLQYPVRVAVEEIEFLEQENRNSILLGNMPHIKALLSRPFVRFMFQHIQNLCWTIERALPHRSNKIHVENSVQAEFFRPMLPRTSALSERPQMPKVWIDVTNTYRSGVGRGIARAVRKLATAAMRTGMALPVILEDGALYPYYKPAGPCEALVLCEDVTYVVIDALGAIRRVYRDL